jgi:hypothetical protein
LRQIRVVALRRAGVDPDDDRLDFLVGQARIVLERTVRGIGAPRRHLPRRDLALIARAYGRASSYVMSDIGANIVGRWHSAQLLYMIGATSLVKVTDGRRRPGRHPLRQASSTRGGNSHISHLLAPYG